MNRTLALRFGGAACIGGACAMLQPEQPQSFIATGLLVVAVNLYAVSRRASR